jgi:hypothetical protein
MVNVASNVCPALEAGKAGTVVADIEGVELQKEFNLPWKKLESNLMLSAGLGLSGRPYLNFDLRPVRWPVKAASMGWSLARGQAGGLIETHQH